MEHPAVRAPSCCARSQWACYYRTHNYSQPLNLPCRQPDWRPVTGSLYFWRTFLTWGVPATPAQGRSIQAIEPRRWEQTGRDKTGGFCSCFGWCDNLSRTKKQVDDRSLFFFFFASQPQCAALLKLNQHSEARARG